MNKISFQYNHERFTAEQNEQIVSALEFATEAHHGQYRLSGEPYIVHPLAVAKTVDGWALDYQAIQAALLHDVVEDTRYQVADLRKLFGDKVAELVDGVTKLDLSAMPGLSPDSPRSKISTENLRKLLLASSNDPRVMIIKLADRLHNLRTLEFQKQEKQERIARESLEIFAPLADRLGMGRVKADIEDLAFKYAKPLEYEMVSKQVGSIVKGSEEYLVRLRQEMTAFLNKGGIKAQSIEGRQKHLYSVYKKLVKTDGDFSKIYDLLAIRVMVPSEADCYHALGLIHQHYKPLIYRIKDYIALPKPNGYRSLHTTVFALDGRITEIQIRTPQMHEEAENGLAAHFFYDAQKGTAAYAKGEAIGVLPSDMSWVKHLAKMEQVAMAGQDADGVKMELFADSIFVFSPKGDLYELPEGATPVDFAFAVHSDVGLRTMGAKVNGRMVNLDSKLENRDVVEVLTRREPAPSRDWLTVVRTSAARNKIRAWFRAVSRDTNVASGRMLMEMELKVLRKGRLDDIPAAKLASGLEALRAKTLDDVLALVGEGMMTPSQAVRKLLPDMVRPASVPVVRRPETTGKVIFEGEQLPYHLAPCCNPIFPQPLVGYVTRGEGVTVHALGCRNTPPDVERLISPRWETTDQPPEMLVCELSIHGHNRVGFLSDVTGLVAERGLNIGHIASRPLDKPLQTEIGFSVEVPDLFVLADIMRQIEKLPGVISVERV